MNASSPMLVTALGIVMEVREEQLLNAATPMLVTELPMVMEVREEQLPNVLSPMLVTELGMVISPVAAALHANNVVFVSSAYTK